MSRSYFKIINVCDIDKYLNIEDECFVYMTEDVAEFIVCKNTSRELFKLGVGKVLLVASGSAKYCSSVSRYLRNIEFDILEPETNGHISEHISAVSSKRSKYIQYDNFSFKLISDIGSISLVGVNTVLMTIVSDVVLDVTRLLDKIKISVDMFYSYNTEYSSSVVDGIYKLRLYGNPLESLFEFVKNINLLAYNKLNKSKYDELISILNCLDSKGIPYDWAFVNIDSNGKLCLDCEQPDEQYSCSDSSDDSLGVTNIFNKHSNSYCNDDDIII